jgi:carboxyl-terminal processing protease
MSLARNKYSWYPYPMKLMQIFTKNTICAILVGVAFFGGFYFSNFLAERQSTFLSASLQGIDLGLMQRVLDTTVNNYVDPQQIDKQKMSYGAIAGMVKAIGDPYTVFFDPDEAKAFAEDISGKFSGIGVQVDEKDGKIKVVAPIKGTPANRAGILAGDTIFEVDKKPVSDLTIDEVVSLIKGPKGTKVTLGILRGKNNEVKTFDIIRDEIVMPSVDLTIKQTPEGKKVGVLTIYHFSDTVYTDFKKLANEMMGQNVDGMVLDLRNNPGGLLNQTDQIAGWFLKKDDVILAEQDRDGNKTMHRSDGTAVLLNVPMVVLVNQGTASAAEILSGALRDDRQIDIIGEKTFGKGVVQKVIDLDDGSALKVTVAKWYTPSGELIQGTGIKPTIEVIFDNKQFEKGIDNQLQKGLSQLDKIIK